MRKASTTMFPEQKEACGSVERRWIIDCGGRRTGGMWPGHGKNLLYKPVLHATPVEAEPFRLNRYGTNVYSPVCKWRDLRPALYPPALKNCRSRKGTSTSEPRTARMSSIAGQNRSAMLRPSTITETGMTHLDTWPPAGGYDRENWIVRSDALESDTKVGGKPTAM